MEKTKKVQKKKLLKSQRELLKSRSKSLADNRLAILRDIESRDMEILSIMINGYAVELGLDVENENWQFNDKDMEFTKQEPKPEPKKVIPGRK